MPANTERTAVAIIPARSGSKRVVHKNIKKLAQHPLMAYTIQSAVQSKVFKRVLVATDSEEYAEIATRYGAETPSLRPREISGELNADIEWVLWAIEVWELSKYDALSILRPTSPLRKASQIIEAWDIFRANAKADSIRAISKAHIHPGKMWSKSSEFIFPLMPFKQKEVPWHSCQTAALPEVFFQNASMEIAWISSILSTQTISGELVLPYHSDDVSSLDVNTPLDFAFLEFLVETGDVTLPSIKI